MKSIVHISAERIEVLGYKRRGKKIRVKHCVAGILPEGAVMNGRIIDDSLLIECLTALRAKYPALLSSPELIVDGSSILHKRIAAPRLNAKQYYRLVRDEFADAAASGVELAYDYRLTASGIHAYAVDKLQIESYISTFGAAGIKLSSIRLGLEAMIEYVASHPALKNETFVINAIDGVTMLSMLFENGVNVFVSRTRLYSEDQEQLVQDIIRNISGLIQFTQSEKLSEITTSYYLGVDEQAVRDIYAAMPFHEIRVKMLNLAEYCTGYKPSAYFAVLGTHLESGVDLIQSLKKLVRFGRPQKPKNYFIPAAAVIAVLIAAPVIWFHMQTSALNSQIGGVNSFIHSAAVREQSAVINDLFEQTAFYNEVIRQRDEKDAYLKSLPHISKQELDMITRTRSDIVTVVMFDYNEERSVVRVNGRSANEYDSAAYTGALKSSPLITGVVYTGYHYDEYGYNFSIDITFAPREGR
ncbi:MAG: hypothetical protein FWH00_04125 [Oscillospiraceae bacterium]|nr:hypothetical protein [Oscillospiraceae bacterium]